MSIWSNKSNVPKSFSQTSIGSYVLTGTPNWMQTKGVLPGQQPIVPSIGAFGYASSAAKKSLNDFPNILAITSR